MSKTNPTPEAAEIKRLYEALYRREKQHGMLGEMSIGLLSCHKDNFYEVMDESLRPIADELGMDRIVLYTRRADTGKWGQAYLWSYGQTRPEPDMLKTLPEIPPVMRWLERLAQGECINDNVAELPEEEAAFLKSYGVKGIYFVPIFTRGKFWGVITLEDHTKYRYFDAEDLNIMRTLAHIAAGAAIRNEMENELFMKDEFNKSILNTAPIGINIIDAGLNFIDCNAHALTLFGCDKDYYLNHFLEFSPEIQADGEKSAEKSARYVSEALEGKPVTTEWLHRTKNGELFPAEVTLRRVDSGGGCHILAYIYDLRNIRKAEESAQMAQELADAIKEASPISYVLFDKDLNPLDCNDSFLQLLGNPDKQYLLDNYREIFTPETQPGGRGYWDSIQEARNKAQTDGGKVYFEWVNRALSGELIPMENTLSFVRYKGEEYLIAFKYDLRETLKLLDDIRDQSDQLKEALKVANAASRAKSEFLSNMSHEMRTPMNAIIGMTSIGKRSDEIEQKDHALLKIGEASSHLMGVINDVLDMAKIEANKLELAPIEFSFERMLQNVLSVINFRADEKEQTLSVKIVGDVPRFVVGDDQRLAQVITNLLSNAVKFTPEGGKIALEAQFSEDAAGFTELHLKVMDSGIGIPPEQQGKLFKAFGQADSTTSRKFGGTGLGLVISRRIVELMGGRIWFESEVGKGTTFFFTVRLLKSEKSPRTMLAPGVNWNNIRILAVDDVKETRRQFQNIFDHLGIECDVAADGSEACGIIEKNGPYDIYFIDWRMPRMDGIELTRWIKGREGGRQSVVTMITAMDWAMIREEALDAGVDRCLLKPLLSSMIIDCVNDCLGARQGEGPRDEIKNGEFAGKKMLLAEDIEINREIIISLLEDTGIEIDSAENGQMALELVEAAPDAYDIILMDVQMPEMDGLTATRKIRALGSTHTGSIPIIAMTANVFKDDIEECLDAGMDDHLGKPLDIDRLVEKLRLYLGTR